MADEGASTLRRAIAILTALGSDPVTSRGSAGVLDISRLVGREKSQVSRTLKTLADTGLVDRDPDTLGYRLGWRLFTLAASAGDQQLIAVAPAVLRRLVAVVGERAHLSVREGDEVLTLMSDSPPHAIQAIGWVGRATPLHTTSSGRALLFDHHDDEVRGLLEGAVFSSDAPNAPRDVEAVLERLRQARQCGYAAVDEEFEAGLVAVAAPVRDIRGRVVAALNVSAPKFRLGSNLDPAGVQVKAAAAQLSRALTRPRAGEQPHPA